MLPSFGSFAVAKPLKVEKSFDPFTGFLDSNDLMGRVGGYIPATVLVVPVRIGRSRGQSGWWCGVEGSTEIPEAGN